MRLIFGESLPDSSNFSWKSMSTVHPRFQTFLIHIEARDKLSRNAQSLQHRETRSYTANNILHTAFSSHAISVFLCKFKIRKHPSCLIGFAQLETVSAIIFTHYKLCAQVGTSIMITDQQI